MEKIIAHLYSNENDTAKLEDSMMQIGENCPWVNGEHKGDLGTNGRVGLNECHLVKGETGNHTAAGNGWIIGGTFGNSLFVLVFSVK